MDAKLKILKGAKTAVVRLKLPTTIGRSQEASLKVPQSQVSRQHCEIYEEDGLLVVDDLGSSNGTFINEERLQEPTFLYPGERLRVGKLTFEAIYDAPHLVGENVDPDGTEIIDDQQQPDESLERAATTTDDDSGSADVLDAAGAEVNYQENEEGSFLGIREIETGEPPVPEASASAENIQIDGQATQQDVDPGDSALNDFFKTFE